MGFVRAEYAAHRLAATEEAYSALLFVRSAAEPNLRRLTELQGLGLKATPINLAPRGQRSYRSQVLVAQGPPEWCSAILNCQLAEGRSDVHQSRPERYWPGKILVLADELLALGAEDAAAWRASAR